MAKGITIRNIRTIMTQPAGQRLIIVKIETSEPDLFGLGCATFTQRHHAVYAAIEKHLKPLLLGCNPANIEDIWQSAMVNGYWRNGPVLNNALSGIDMALWDIKGKTAGLPVYDLFGGKCREAAAVYAHAGGDTPEKVADSALAFMEEGYHHVRVQMGGYGSPTEGLIQARPEGSPEGAYFDRKAYMRGTIRMLEKVRKTVGDNLELLHDVHERLTPIQAVGFAKALEQFDLFFLEDLLAPEDIEWFQNIRSQCSTPLAMGELFNNQREWQPLISGRLIDFIRMHISQMGGITPARHTVSLANVFGVRTAWHGPGDTSPVGHAANLHLDLWAPNFGIQEWCRFPELVYEIFPGTPVVKNGYMYSNGKPGLGIEINEELAAQYPCDEKVVEWTKTRTPDGSPVRP